MKKSEIKQIKAKEILDSRGKLTIEVELITELGSFFASVPSGTSTGKNEAKALTITQALENIEKIIFPALKGKETSNQKEIDDLMIRLDGTKDKSRLGANALLGISMAVCRSGSAVKGLPLCKHISELTETGSRDLPRPGLGRMPKPCLLMIEGGAHAKNDLDFQEFMIIPKSDSFSENYKIANKVYQTLKKILEKEKLSTEIGMEGGFAPALKFPEQALDLIVKAIEKAGYKDKIGLILDCAASQFPKNNKYNSQYYLDLISKYPILGLEDPFGEEEWHLWREFTETALTETGSRSIYRDPVSVIGDDLLVTNIERLKRAVKEQSCNAMIVKPNQIGTVSETLEVVKYAQENNFKIFVKHRSGETNDDFISDLAVGLGADGIMAGAPSKPERLAKYNRLLKIEEWLN